MELRHLRYFVAVAEDLHFRRAAERLHVVQPAVSEQVRKLEAELGVRLLDRTRRSVSLTDAGAVMLEEARRVLHQADVAERAVRDVRDHKRLRLRVGYLPDSLPPSLPRTLRHLGAAASDLDIRLQTGPAVSLVEDVREGRLDVAIVGVPAPTSGLRVDSLGHQAPVAVLGASDALAREPGLTLRRLAPEQLVMLPRDANPALHNAIVSHCHRAGVAPALMEVAEPRVELVLLSVAAGAGVALLPESVVERHALPGVRMVQLADAETFLESVVVSDPAAESAATTMFVRTITHVARLGQTGSLRPALVHAA
jgi:DNA-binding transcriptional LysR family regulator